MPQPWMAHLTPADVAELDQWTAASRDHLHAAVTSARTLVGRHEPVMAAHLIADSLEDQPGQRLALMLAWALITLAEQPGGDDRG